MGYQLAFKAPPLTRYMKQCSFLFHDLTDSVTLWINYKHHQIHGKWHWDNTRTATVTQEKSPQDLEDLFSFIGEDFNNKPFWGARGHLRDWGKNCTEIECLSAIWCYTGRSRFIRPSFFFLLLSAQRGEKADVVRLNSAVVSLEHCWG